MSAFKQPYQPPAVLPTKAIWLLQRFRYAEQPLTFITHTFFSSRTGYFPPPAFVRCIILPQAFSHLALLLLFFQHTFPAGVHAHEGPGILLRGGIGYTTSYPVERFLRDAKVIEMYEGTSEVMKIVISGAVLA